MFIEAFLSPIYPGSVHQANLVEIRLLWLGHNETDAKALVVIGTLCRSSLLTSSNLISTNLRPDFKSLPGFKCFGTLDREDAYV